MKMKGFLLALGLLGGIFAVSKVYSPAAGLMIFVLITVLLSFGYIIQLFNDLEKAAQKAEESSRACAAIRMQRKPKARP